jgi:hypothetical protein
MRRGCVKTTMRDGQKCKGQQRLEYSIGGTYSKASNGGISRGLAQKESRWKVRYDKRMYE